MTSPLKPPKLLAEALGTFFLVFIGCGAIAANESFSGRLSHVGVSLAFGLVVLAMIHALGRVSGAHLNPAVSLAFWRLKRMGGREALAYAGAQMLGATAGAGVLRFIFPGSGNSLGMTSPHGAPGPAFLMELLLTVLLVLVILSVATGAKEEGLLAGVAVGSAVTLCALVGGPVSGASMNPARSFGPALVRMDFSAHWIYWLAPALGAWAAVEIHRLLRCDSTAVAGKGPGCC